MRKFTVCAGLFLVLVVNASWAGGFAEPGGLPQPQIKEIIQSSKYLDATVQVTGTYQGNYSKIGPPPVTRSDYILEDTTGQIFVSGPLPLHLSPKDIGKTVTIKAKVKTKVIDVAGKKQSATYLQIL